MNKYEFIYMVDARLSDGEKGEVAKLVADMLAFSNLIMTSRLLSAAGGSLSCEMYVSSSSASRNSMMRPMATLD